MKQLTLPEDLMARAPKHDNSEPSRQDENGRIKKSHQTRQRILDVAAYWLNRKGWALTSLQYLAEDIGIRAASIYYYFNSKDELVDEVLRIGIDLVHEEVARKVEELGPDAPYRERIKTAIEAHLSSLLRHGEYTSANIRNFPLAPESIRENNRLIRRKYGEYWRKLFSDAQAAGEIAADLDLTLVRLLLIGGLNWSTDWFNPRKKSVAEIAEESCKILFNGIAAKSVKAPRGKLRVKSKIQTATGTSRFTPLTKFGTPTK